MIRRICASLTLVSLLTACGGGGGGSSTVPSVPKQPQSALATFAFKIPGKGTMARVRRPAYVSQATAGIAIDWTSTNPRTPDFAAAVSATCPGTLPAGVTACTIDAAGNTDYTLQLQIPAGTYTITVTGFDAAPVSNAFASGTMLSQGQLAAPVTITAGIANTVPSLTFYGVPASVSLTAGPGQPHVINNGTSIGIIGNAPQTVFVQALDADGFAISSNDSGAPTLTLQEAASDSPAHFTIAPTANKYAYTLTAVDASAVANITASATPGGTGLGTPASTLYSVTPIQELWASQAGGTGTAGIAGYPLLSYSSTTINAPLDLANPVLGTCPGQCNWSWAAMAPNGNIWVYESYQGVLYEFTQGSGTPALTAPTSPSVIPVGASPQGFTIDSGGLIYLTDATTSTIKIYDTNAPSATPLATLSESHGTPTSVAVAPSAPNVPAALAGSIWVADSTNIAVFAKYASGVPAGPFSPSTPPGAAQGLAFDPTGDLWVYDSSDSLVDVYSIGGTPSSPSMTLIAQTTPPLYDGASQLGVTAQQVGWMGGPGSLNGIYPYTLSGSTLTAGANQMSLPSVWGVMIAP